MTLNLTFLIIMAEGCLERLRAPKLTPTPLLLSANNGLLREEAKQLLSEGFQLGEAHCKSVTTFHGGVMRIFLPSSCILAKFSALV